MANIIPPNILKDKNINNIEKTQRSKLKTPKYCIFLIYIILNFKFFICSNSYSSIVHTFIFLIIEASAKNLLVYASNNNEIAGNITAGVVISKTTVNSPTLL